MFERIKNMISKNRCCCETKISNIHLQDMIKEGAILLDVRSPQEYEEGHLENAIIIPFYEIEKKINDISHDKSKVIIVYCNTGHRSKKAQKVLQKMGYKHVYNLCNKQ